MGVRQATVDCPGGSSRRRAAPSVRRHSARRPACCFFSPGGRGSDPSFSSHRTPGRAVVIGQTDGMLVLVVLQALSGHASCGGTGPHSRSENSYPADVLGLCAHERTEQLEVLDCILNNCILIHCCNVYELSLSSNCYFSIVVL